MRTRLLAAATVAFLALPLPAASAADKPCDERTGGVSHKCDQSRG